MQVEFFAILLLASKNFDSLDLYYMKSLESFPKDSQSIVSSWLSGNRQPPLRTPSLIKKEANFAWLQ